MAWAQRSLLDLAHRCSGIAITHTVNAGLTAAEAAFLAGIKDRLQDVVLFDIGAHAGAYASHLRRIAPTSTIYAFEPHPSTFRRMLKRIEGQNIRAVQMALSSKSGLMQLHDMGDGSPQASLDPAAITLFSPKVTSHDVVVTTVDAFMADHKIDRIALLKIDTEGFDLDVLKGAQKALAERRIEVIQFEFIPANVARRIFLRDFFETLPNYRVHRLLANGDLLPLKYDVKHEIFVTQNLVATLR